MDEKKQKSWIVTFIITIFILGMFAIGALFLVNIGMQVYKNVVVANNDNFRLRTSLSYIATKVRQNETEGMISVEEEDGIQMLVLGEVLDGERYNTCIYFLDGALRELIQKDGYPVDLKYGFETVEIDKFNIEELPEGGIQLTAENNAGDQEQLTLYPRTGR